jgi:hypothetical protein
MTHKYLFAGWYTCTLRRCTSRTCGSSFVVRPGEGQETHTTTVHRRLCEYATHAIFRRAGFWMVLTCGTHAAVSRDVDSHCKQGITAAWFSSIRVHIPVLVVSCRLQCLTKVCKHAYVCMYVCMHVFQMSVCACIYVYICICMYVCIYILLVTVVSSVSMYIYIYIYICIYTYTHTRVHIAWKQRTNHLGKQVHCLDIAHISCRRKQRVCLLQSVFREHALTRVSQGGLPISRPLQEHTCLFQLIRTCARTQRVGFCQILHNLECFIVYKKSTVYFSCFRLSHTANCGCMNSAVFWKPCAYMQELTNATMPSNPDRVNWFQLICLFLSLIRRMCAMRCWHGLLLTCRPRRGLGVLGIHALDTQYTVTVQQHPPILSIPTYMFR